MAARKKRIAQLTKCYCVAPFRDARGEHILVASEKDYPCLMFDLAGNYEETLWETPGGVMSMAQAPGVTDCLLTTKKFYSPNDSKSAYIASVFREDGIWKEHTLCALPHAHRFDIIKVGEVNYLFAATLLSRRDVKDDWSYPGKVYAGVIPKDPRKGAIELEALHENLLKNHGYTSIVVGGQKTPVIASESGVFAYHPEKGAGRISWRVEMLASEPASEVRFIDFDGDGKDEMVVLTPFHGDTLLVYRQRCGRWERAFEYSEQLPFAHALCPLTVSGRNGAVVGHREGGMKLLFLYYKDGKYLTDLIDEGAGSANALAFDTGGEQILISANRQTNEIALYSFDGQ